VDWALGAARPPPIWRGLKTQMLDEAKRVFKPELLNRMDDVIVFRPLSRDDVGLILELELRQVRARMAAKAYRNPIESGSKSLLD